MSASWTTDNEELLEKLRINCVNLSEYHRKRYYYFKGYSKYFRIPILILSSVNATTAVGLQTFIAQKWISLTNCFLGMVIGTITAVELYMNITANMDVELNQSKEYYTMAVDIYKMLHVPREQRGEDGNTYLNKKYSYYTKLKEGEILMHKRLKVDTITKIPDFIRMKDGSDGSKTPDTPDKEQTAISLTQLFGLHKSQQFFNVSLDETKDLENCDVRVT